MVRNIAIVAALAIAALLGATWYMTRGEAEDQFAQCRRSSVGTGVASIGGPFEGIDETGRQVTDRDIITKPTILYFGYTFCPDVCPTDSLRNAEAVDILAERGYDVQPVFYSIDPDRDTPERLADFTDFMHPDLIGVTGTPEQVKAASQAYKTYYRKQDEADDEFYLVDHSTFSYFVTPEHGFLEFFKRDDSPEQMADRVGCFLDAAKR